MAEITDIQAGIRKTLDLRNGPTGNDEILNKFPVAASVKAFRNIGHNRDGCSLYLILEPIILAFAKEFIDIRHK
jgi:hypothetical protein